MAYHHLFGTRMLMLILLVWVGISALTSYLLYSKFFNHDKASHWVMMGNLTASSISFRVRHAAALLGEDVLDLKVFPLSGGDSTTPIYETELQTQDDLLVHSVDLGNLSESTDYRFQLSGSTVLEEGNFRTAPAENSTAGFRFLASSCAYTGTKHDVFSKMLDQKGVALSPLLFMVYLGDFHYEDLSTPSVKERIEAMDLSLGAANQKQFFANVPIAYMWDDHDFLGNNLGGLDANDVDLQAALDQFQISIPHYPLVNETRSMHQAFTIGKVRFILTDLRSEAGEFVQIMSPAQEAWLLDEFAQSDKYDFVIWGSSVPWIGVNDDPLDPSDAWWGFSKQRRRISMFLSSDELPKRNVLVMAGDSHMLAFDDGSNTYHGDARDDAYSFPILQTGPLDRLGSFKGGPFSQGCFAKKFERNHQYSLIEYSSENAKPCLIITAYSVSDINGKQEEVFQQELCGPDIFQKEGQTAGTCDETFFTTISIVLMALAAAFYIPILGMLLCSDLWESCGFAGFMGFVVSLFLGLVFVVGRLLPFAVGGTSLYDVFSVTLIGFFATLTVLVHLVLWRRVIKHQEEAMESTHQEQYHNDQKPNHGSESDQDQEQPTGSE
ncbi:MAG: hypothetical protein SGBAC_007825 [Bacillariaceae sp.]